MLIDVASRAFRAQHKPVAVRPGGAAALALDAATLPWANTPKGERKARVNNYLHPPVTELADPALVFLQPRTAEPQLTPMSNARAIQHLLQVMGTESGDLDHRLDLAATLAEGTRTFSLSAGDPRATARLLMERLGQ